MLSWRLFSRHEEACTGPRTAEESLGAGRLCPAPLFALSRDQASTKSRWARLCRKPLGLRALIDPAELAQLKHQTNDWELQYREQAGWPEPRPLNLDPGYLTEAKLVLASTKDRDHRIYLDHGIFAEGTLYFQHGHWQTRPGPIRTTNGAIIIGFSTAAATYSAAALPPTTSRHRFTRPPQECRMSPLAAAWLSRRDGAQPAHRLGR